MSGEQRRLMGIWAIAEAGQAPTEAEAPKL